MVANPRNRYLVFERKEVPLGVVNFVNIDRRHSRAHWGIYLGEEKQPRATGSVLGYCGLEYGFKRLGLRRIMAEMMESNLRSIKLHTKLGFIQEGRFRAHVIKNGSFQDVLTFALLAEDWATLCRSQLGESLFSDWRDEA